MSDKTIYECCAIGRDVNKTLSVRHYGGTQNESIKWLEKNGGGMLRNTLHNYQFSVDAKPDTGDFLSLFRRKAISHG